MISSMTGFGRAAAELDGLTVTVELRSVNNRFCEVSIRAPRELSSLETEMQARIKNSFKRGRISAQIQLERAQSEVKVVGINKAVAKQYGKMLRELRKAASVKEQVGLAHLLHFPEVLQRSDGRNESEDVLRKIVAAALDAAIESMKVMRNKEGAVLQRDLLERGRLLEEHTASVESRSPERVAAARNRLKTRIADLVDDERINAERLEFEIALLADKLDVTEETVRLRSHLGQFVEALNESGEIGRKLNFITQELNREINTVGSKANDPEMTRIVVSMKEELEKIKEQIENVE